MHETDINDKKTLAVFVPTYNRGAVIEEFLTEQLHIFAENDIDAYICDSSEKDETEVITANFQKIYSNLYYTRFPSDTHSNMKVYMIYQKHGWAREYDYVWVIGDALRFSGEIIVNVENTAKTGEYDMLVTYFFTNDRSEPVITDINRFFVDYAWMLNLYGSCVLNTKTMLTGVNWDYLIERYCITERVNFSHTCFYFEQIAKLDSFKAKEIYTNGLTVKVSKLRKYTGWHEYTFIFCLDYCPSAINALPDVYTCKDKLNAIRSFGSRSTIFTVYSFIELKKCNIFNYNVYKQFKKKWSQYSGKSPLLFYFYAKVSVRFLVFCLKLGDAIKQNSVYRKILYRYVRRPAARKRMKVFCKKYDNIYIYGAGLVARRYIKYLKMMHIDLKGLLVTDIDKQNQRIIDGIPVVNFYSLPGDKNTGIILGLNPENAIEVKHYLIEHNFNGGLFNEYI